LREILKKITKKYIILSVSLLSLAISYTSFPVSSLPLPSDNYEFIFCSGAGAWETRFSVDRDGSFTGYYYDANMGEMNEDYPKGTMAVCAFSGKFSSFGKINDYSYKMMLSNVKEDFTAGESWIKDGIKYIAARPYGIEEGKEYILYLPDTPLDHVSAEFYSWWPLRYDQDEDPKETLSCYGIYNLNTGYGFFDVY